MLCEEAVRKDADRFFVFQDDKLPDASGCGFSPSEETAVLLYLCKPADSLRVEKAERAFFALRICLRFWLTSFFSLANALLFADGTIDSWTQSYVEV